MTDRRRTKVMFRTCLAAVVVGLFAFIVFFQHYSHAKALHQVQEHAKIVANSLWTFETQSPTTYLTLAAQTLGYDRAEIKDSAGSLFLTIDGPPPSRSEKLFSKMGLIPRYHLESPIVHEANPIGSLAVVWRCRMIYTYLYTLLCAFLLLAGAWLLLNLWQAKTTLEIRVRERTAALEKENIERRQAEHSLQESQANLQVAMEVAKLAHWEADVTTGLFLFNDAFYAMYGTTAEREGGYYMDGMEYARRFLPSEDAQAYADLIVRTMEAHDPEYANQMEHRIIRRDGQERFVVSRFRVSLDETGRLVRTYGVNQDITERIQAENERKKLEELLRQSQKLEAIGTLAGGIAHDFNNLLSVILGHAELLQLGITDATQTQHSLDQVVSASERARNLVHQILAFSRHAEHPRQLFHLEAVVQETVAFLRASLPTTIQIDSSLQASIPPILGDPTQIQQVLINLSTNAAHAMEAQGGLLRIALERIHLDPGQARHYAGIAPGDYVQLSVTDTGCGIDPAIMDRIFDPYFTTKEFGKGSGLGLSVVHGIVSAHDGAIRIDSEPGKGATFNILLPPAPAQQRDPSQQASTAALPRGNESILLVDDEPTLVDLTQQMLTHLGYRVEAQTNPVRALDLFRTKPEGYDLVITDMTMPELTGLHLAQELLHMRPEQRIMLCTGYSDQIDEPQARAMGIHCFALKPMAIKDLAVAVRTTLDQ